MCAHGIDLPDSGQHYYAGDRQVRGRVRVGCVSSAVCQVRVVRTETNGSEFGSATSVCILSMYRFLFCNDFLLAFVLVVTPRQILGQFYGTSCGPRSSGKCRGSSWTVMSDCVSVSLSTQHLKQIGANCQRLSCTTVIDCATTVYSM